MAYFAHSKLKLEYNNKLNANYKKRRFIQRLLSLFFLLIF